MASVMDSRVPSEVPGVTDDDEGGRPAMSSMMADMMKAMPMREMTGMDMPMMQRCIEACSAASMAATMCADADSRENMGRCASMCMNTADVATAMMRMMMRPGGYDMGVMTSMMSACMAMGEACAAECETHAAMSEHCRICASACRAMVDACSSAMSGMRSA